MVHRKTELSVSAGVSDGQSTSCAKWKIKAALIRYSSSVVCAVPLGPPPLSNTERRTANNAAARFPRPCANRPRRTGEAWQDDGAFIQNRHVSLAYALRRIRLGCTVKSGPEYSW